MLFDKTRRKLDGIEKCSIGNKHKAQDLFKIAIESLDLWKQAYINIHANKGAMTAGIDGLTVDGHTEERIINLIKLLKSNRYVPKPTKRVYIPKANGKTRPLGIPSINDKLVQEVWRILLERIFESVFSEDSHGFRPQRSCHTALEGIKHKWSGTKWFIEFDIKGYFDNINHQKLIQILEKRINDRKFISIIKRMLKAGYLENWKFHRTYSGIPQGGIISPILANIYLNELDEYIKKLQNEYTKGKRRRPNPKYRKVKCAKSKTAKKIKEAKEEGSTELALRLINDWKKLGESQRRIPSGDSYDPNYRRLWYSRYADDFVLGLIGPKKEATEIKEKITTFLKVELELEISPEKSGIQHASEGIKFLGYEVVVSSNEKTLKMVINGKATKKRTVKERISLRVPISRLKKFTEERKYGKWEIHKAVHRPALLNNSDVEIILQYNAELRGLANYYALANNVKRSIDRVINIGHTSLYKTLAAKHKLSVQKVCKWLDKGSYKALRHKGKEYKIFATKDIKKRTAKYDIDVLPKMYKYESWTELDKRIEANVCEYCGKKEGYFEVHHIKKMKDLKDGKADWQKHMVARKRKTMVLCIQCHDLLHAGKLPDKRHYQDRMESAVR